MLCTMATFGYGDKATYGSEVVTIVRVLRKYGQDGYLVQDRPPGDYGALAPYPRWVPASDLREVS